MRGDAVGHHEVDVAGAQCLNRGAEGLEQLDARVGLVAVEDVIDGDIERRRAGLGGDQQILVFSERLLVGEAFLVGAHQHAHLGMHV